MMSRIRTNLDLPVVLDRETGVALHRQIEASLRECIRDGRLRGGFVMPPSRALAADLGVSRGVVVEAYQQLIAEGYLTSRPGGTTQVAIDAAAPTSSAEFDEADSARPAPGSMPVPVGAPSIDLSYGRADVSHFPRAAWLRAVRGALANAPHDAFGYPSGRGMPALRAAIAEYLNRVRATEAAPERVIICTGYAQGVALLVQVLGNGGARRLAVEDPSPGDDAVPAARAAGLDVIGVPVDEDGICIDALRASDADAVVLTPSHQWPTGAVLSAERRAAVLEWAVDRGALIIEDDYDAEYRYDRTPLGALQGLAPDHVVYAGSASKILAPGLRLAWFVVPERLCGAMADAKIAADRGSPALEQLALADLLSRGELDRHLRRMRPVYRRRSDALVGALEHRLPELRPAGISAGLHLVAWLPERLDEAQVVRAAAQRGLRLDGLRRYRLATTGPAGLIFGFATLSEANLVQSVNILADAIAEL
jgi:GntR family transcriptional regulator / MocR family aminotransferase